MRCMPGVTSGAVLVCPVKVHRWPIMRRYTTVELYFTVDLNKMHIVTGVAIILSIGVKHKESR